jgi:hypothetical protein
MVQWRPDLCTKILLRCGMIYIETLNCFFSGQFKKTLDLQGLAARAGKLSTKLSTENLEICKALVNQ